MSVSGISLAKFIVGSVLAIAIAACSGGEKDQKEVAPPNAPLLETEIETDLPDSNESKTGVIIGTDSKDKIDGTDSDDLIKGLRGADILYGGKGNDILNGNGGADILSGGPGFDRLNGGYGDDILEGGFNADTFIFRPRFGNDTIRDFEASNDAEKIDLSAIETISSFDDLLSLHISQVNKNVVIDDGNGSTITLIDVDLVDLGETDFRF